MNPEEDLWGAPRSLDEPEDDIGEPTAAMSMRQRIRLIGKAAMLQKADENNAQQGKVEAPVRKIKGLKNHVHTEQYKKIRNINKQTCFNAMLSLLLAVISVRKRAMRAPSWRTSHKRFADGVPTVFRRMRFAGAKQESSRRPTRSKDRSPSQL
jgi:hypothetical protein